jgi:outer membrane protein assembly factor BamB
MTRRRWIVIAFAAAIVLGVVAAAGGWLYHERTTVKEVRGSSTVEFVPRDRPQAKPRPAKAVEKVPWPTYGYDNQRTHLAPFRLKPPYRQQWFYRSGNLLEFPPVVTQNLVIGSHQRGSLFALHKSDGKVAWRIQFDHCAAASPTVVGDVIYMTFMAPKPCARYPRTQKGFVAALRVADGRELWRKTFTVSESSLLYVKGILYFGSWDGAVYALDARTRKVRWRTQTDGEVQSSAAYAAGKVYVGNNAGSIYAIDAKTGAVRWRGRSAGGFLRNREYFYATPTVAYGRVYAGNTDGSVYAFGATTGNLLWERRAGTYVYTAPAVWDRKIFVGTYDGRFLALDAATGDTVWSFDAPASIHGAPTVMNGIVYFATCGTCGMHGIRSAKLGPRMTIALNARTGKQLWSFRDGQYSPVVADESHLYIAGRAWVYGLVPVHRE